MDHKVYSVVSSYPLDCVVIMVDEWRKHMVLKSKGVREGRGGLEGVMLFEGIGQLRHGTLSVQRGAGSKTLDIHTYQLGHGIGSFPKLS